ncbi:hypothetical protein DFH07DRAFT_871547 [Mycena maculata]|uniref:CxC1-like cysteine cluster associated with KDZ transposases domain-containing protein n=1 Tax=Mycena maculata TaxID=230809 RepID=A0AAD7HU99_9AGAR|nr:hypothetical protein DFH07DRAFT_871547 [Mycena maculata]
MSQEQRRELDAIRDLPDPYGDDDAWEDDILHGRAPAEISHAGEAIPEDPELNVWGRRRHQDYRTRRNRTQLQVDGFTKQMERMADAYLGLGVAAGGEGGLAASYIPEEGTEIRERRDVLVVDIFCESACILVSAQVVIDCASLAASHQDLCLIDTDLLVSSACVYRITHLRCPRLGIQAFVRALCDIHGVPPRPWLGTQFSVAFDVYLAIRAVVDRRVEAALGRDTPHWRLKNACPCCLYKLEGEPCMKIPFIGTIDGNNSLSRWWLREKVEVENSVAPGASRERMDNRVAPGDYYLPREEVDRWGKEGEADLMKGRSADEDADDKEEAGCSERWQNMKEDVTSRSYGMYDETGFFPALCRHGFVLKVVDMVRSGELSLLRYDIGCKFGKKVKVHPALKELARDKKFRALVGSFHGHGHNRLCGLDNLMTYVEGVGLEAGEICETFFSKSNALAATTRYASRFHRQQAITTYLKHTDTFDTYQGLTVLLCNKYRRALGIKATYATLRQSMRELGVQSRSEFETWRAKERGHLRSLSKEPEQETLEMEYFQKLVNLRGIEERVASILGVERPFIPTENDTAYAEAAKSTRRLETQRRHALELQVKALAAVHDLEDQLDITARWMPGDQKWEAVAGMVRKRRYQRALDHLQGLIISRMFELAKCNMSGTGYKLRKHIAKALQARSKAVKNAITRYNAAAESMTPSKPTLDWDEVVEYAFLADFDLLREGREDIRGELWAQPAGRAAMDQHYKLLRADEEIERLNIEIRRLVTYMRDEGEFLGREEGRLREEGKVGLAVQVGLLRMERGRFTSLHMSRLVKLSKEPGFTGDLVPGISICRERHTPVARDSGMDVEMRAPSPLPLVEDGPVPPTSDEEEEEGLESDDEDGGLSAAFMNVIRISNDTDGETQDS